MMNSFNRPSFVAVTVAAMVGYGNAQAADQTPSKSGNVTPSWTGVYAGISMGGSFGHSKDEFWYRSGLYGARRFSTEGFSGGAYLGYNYQIGSTIIGLEAEGVGSSVASEVSWRGTYGAFGTLTNSVGWQASVRARAGYAIENVLIYATAGVAIAAPKTSLFGYNPIIGDLRLSASAVRPGPSVGVGVEYRLDKHWAIRADYRYAQFAPQQISGQTAVTDLIKNAARVNTISLGLSYHF
jgi:outer membrane immunogenic protein